MTHPRINFQHLTVSEIWPRQDLKVMVTTARSEVKSRLHHDVAHVHLPTNVPITYQHHTSYGSSNIALIKFQRSGSLWQGHIKATL